MNFDFQSNSKYIVIFFIFKENLSVYKKINGLLVDFYIFELIYRIFIIYIVEQLFVI